ncbi:hypothetical protein DACRYDRAFT_98198 [Dacryopinax primogenitus]|uniref:Uncharacterized protein n=1 Tax=Dacryopinax primogenitus (strain DJM 731) TaxID=1858805 RepID=M5GAS9_DACPD|nr:uncharacterized protein DACRYDRAFT_98198 [Dacryopinax primogenitus]EJU05480.1 hypothetical protein DACRYDRAFT_98198 [Dacryopinax primogenitus]
MATTLPLYYTLASPSTTDRLDASVSLLSALEQFQSQHALPSTVEGDEAQQFEALNAADVQYAVNRLVKGLASSREQSRLGFAVALTELLQRIPTISCSHVISLVLDTTNFSGGMSGAEQRDLLFARLFGLTAIIESGVLFRTQPPAVGPSDLKLLPTIDDFATVITELISLGEQKNWLKESAWWAVLQALDALYESKVSWKKDAITRMVVEIFEANKEWSLEKFTLGVRLQRREPELAWGPMVAPTFKQSNLLGAGNLPAVARLFKGATAEETEGTEKGTSPSTPQLHAAWDIILDSYFTPSSTGKLSPSSEFQDFFRIVVDDSLFASTASDIRKAWGFQVVAKVLPRAPAAQLPLIFTPNFMRTWINHLSKQDRYLHKAATTLVEDIRKVAQENPSVAYTLIAQLTGKHGNKRFDAITKTKTVQSLVEAMDPNGVEEYTTFLLTAACEGADAEGTRGIDAKRIWVLDQLHVLVRNTAVPKSKGCINKILEFLTVHGFFIMKKASSKSTIATLHTMPEPLFSSAVQEKCREKLYASLALLNAQRVSSKAKAQLNGSSGDELAVIDWFDRCLAVLQKLAKDKKHVMPLLEADEDVLGLRTSVIHTLSRISEMMTKKPLVSAACTLLLQYLMLQTYADDIDTSETLPDSIQATSKLLDLNVSSEASSEEVGAEPIDLLMDVLMALLESDANHAREVAGQVFGGLTKEVSGSTIQFILEQLESKRAGDGEEDEDADMDEDEDETESNGAENDEAESSESQEDEDEDEDDTEEEDEEEDTAQAAATAALRARLGEVLKANGLGADTDEETDISEEATNEDIVDDDTMLKLDDQLAAALRSQVGDKKGQKNAQREATHFKIRVLDLIDIYLKNEPTSELSLQIMLPLLDLALFSSSDESQLSNKATGILNQRFGHAKEMPVPTSDEAAAECLRGVLDRMRRTDPSPLVLHCFGFLNRVLSRQGKEANATLVNFYQEALQGFVMRRSPGIPLSIFSKLISSVPVCGWAIRDTIMTLMTATGAPNRFNQRKLVELLGLVLGYATNEGRAVEISDVQRAEFFESLRKTIYEALVQALDAPSFLSDYTRDLLKCLHRGIRTANKVTGAEQGDTIWDASAFAGIQARLEKEHGNVPSIINLVQEVSKALKPDTDMGQTKKANRKVDQAIAVPPSPTIVTNVATDKDAKLQSSKLKSKLKRSAESGVSVQPQKKKKIKASS